MLQIRRALSETPHLHQKDAGWIQDLMSLPSAHGCITTPALRPARPSPCPFSHGYDSHHRFSGGGTLQCSSLKNSMDRGAWWATVHGVTKGSDTTKATKQQQHRKPRTAGALLSPLTFTLIPPFLISSPPLSKFYKISLLVPGIGVSNSLCALSLSFER